MKQRRIPPTFPHSIRFDLLPQIYFLARPQLLTYGKRCPIGRTIPPVHAVSAPPRSNGKELGVRALGPLRAED